MSLGNGQPAQRASRHRHTLGSCAALLLGVFVAWPGAAHPGHSRSSRLVKVDVGLGAVTVHYALVLETAASEAWRQRADHDRDGSVSGEESERELLNMTAELRDGVALCRGASLAALSCSNVTEERVVDATATGFSNATGTVAFSWKIAFEVAASDRAFRLDDGWFQPDVDRTDILLEPAEGLVLERSGAGAEDESSAVAREFSLGEDRRGERRRVFAVWSAPTHGWVPLGLVGVAALALAGPLMVRSRTRYQARCVAAARPR